MWIRRFLIAFLLAATTLAALAFDRPFPDNVQRGTMSPSAYPFIFISGKLRRLSAGAQIRNSDNLIQVPDDLNRSEYVVNYVENAQGEIHRIWILTPAEAALDLPAK